MKLNSLQTLRKWNVVLMRCAMFGLMALGTTPFSGQSPAQESLAGSPRDWSHHHLIYSAPASVTEAARLPESRYWQQWFHRNATLIRRPAPFPKRPRPSNEGIWGESLASTATAGTVGPGNYPAKYSFNGSVSCSDFTVFNTSLTGGAGGAIVTFSNAPDTTGSIKITNASTGASLTLTAGTSNSGTTWNNNSATGSVNAGNFNTVLNTAGNGSSVGVYSTVSTSTVTIAASQLGAVTISLANTTLGNVAAPGSLTGGANAARVLAYKSLYSGTCGTIGGAVPTLSWQYETGGAVRTSISLSGDGTQLAFIQSYQTGSATTAAELILLKPGLLSSTLSFPAIATAAAYRACTAPCMTRFALGNDDNNSSPFVDYSGDNLYVGDNAGSLHKFTGVFNGTPAAASSPWPVAVSANKLTSPVYDSTSAFVFVADSGGFLYSYNAAAGTFKAKSSQLAQTGSTGIVDAPLVDSSAGTVYVVVGKDFNVTTSVLCQNANGCDGAFQFSIVAFNSAGTGTGACASTNGTTWATGTNCGSESVFGNGSATTTLYDGNFDNTHYSSGGTAGSLWSCANNGNTGFSKLVSTALTSFSAAVSIATNSGGFITNAASTCSPVTEINNGSDFIYMSVSAGGSLTGCTGGCIYSFTVSGTTATFSHGLQASGGASGIVVDNTGSGGGSQIYFSYLSAATSAITCPAPSGGGSNAATSGGCAVQASQSALN